MTRRIRLALPGILVGALLAGCEPAVDGNASAPAGANEAGTNYQAAVAQLSPGQRNGVMIRAIRDAGLQCQGVTESEAMAGRAGTWRARCSDGRDHLVEIAPDGNAKVVSGAGAR